MKTKQEKQQKAWEEYLDADRQACKVYGAKLKQIDAEEEE